MGTIVYKGRYKIKTHIRGLDNILHGGIVYHGIDINPNGDKEDGVLVSLNGERGVNKTDLAIHLCHGITRSLYRIKGEEPEQYQSTFYSVNKTENLLQQMHENAATSRLLRRGIQDYIIENYDNKESSLLFKIVKTFFSEKADVSYTREKSDEESFATLYEGKDVEVCELLANSVVSFNVHSRTLNFRHLKNNTGFNRIRIFRQFNDVKTDDDFIKEYLQPIKFDGIVNDHTTKFISRFEEILERLVELYERSNDGSRKVPCLVVDGLSQLTTEELQTIPIEYLQRIMRKVAYVSILVFDERGKEICRDSDMIFELNRNTDKDVSSFSYNSLEIKKCLTQKFSSGKHLYKLKETGMSVFPSLEHTLNYSALKSNTFSDFERRMFNMSYSNYLKDFRRNLFNNALIDENDENYDIISNTIESNPQTYRQYLEDKGSNISQYIEHVRECSSSEIGEKACEKLLDNILFRARISNEEEDSGNLITSLVGAMNSYKRYLSNAVIFNSIHSDKNKRQSEKATRDVLYISFSNNRQKLLRTVICPCLSKHICKDCKDCHERIHLYSVPFGDISASELLYMIDDIVETYNRKDSKHVIGQILIDELNGEVAKSAHPFIHKDRLLMPALFKLLRDKQIPTMILCDVSEQGYKDICDFADNVIFTQRRQTKSDPYDEVLDVFVTKNYRYCYHRKLYGCSVKISEREDMIMHEGETFTLNPEMIDNDREVSPLEVK